MVSFKISLAVLTCLGTGALAAPAGINTDGARDGSMVNYVNTDTNIRTVCYVSAQNEPKMLADLAGMSTFQQTSSFGFPAWVARGYPAQSGEKVFTTLCNMYKGHSNAIPVPPKSFGEIAGSAKAMKNIMG